VGKKHEGKIGMEHGMMGEEKWGMMML